MSATTVPAYLSLWHEDAGIDGTVRAVLPADLDVDVAIVGGGYTGLWTAYYLAEADPEVDARMDLDGRRRQVAQFRG